MDLTEIAIIFINVLATTFGFSGLLKGFLYMFSGEKLSFPKTYVILYVVSCIISFVAVSFVPLVLFCTSFVILCLKRIKLLHNILTCISAIAIFSILLTIISIVDSFLLRLPIATIMELRHVISYNVFNSAVFVMISSICIYGVSIISKRSHNINIMTETDVINNKKLVLILGTVIFFITLTSTAWFVSFLDKERMAYYVMFVGIISVIVAAFIIFLVYITLRMLAQKVNEIETEKNKEITEMYIKDIQAMYDNVRDFKHDYMKIYSSMSLLLNNNDIEQIRDFFETEIAPLQKEILGGTDVCCGLTMLNDPIVRGTVYNYIVRAKNTDMNFHINIHEEIPRCRTFSSLEISRILGILLDNAFESASKSENKQVVFAAAFYNGQIRFSIKNDCREKPNMAEIFGCNYSTKGEGHGRGLDITRKICNKYDNVYFDIKYINNQFVADITTE